MIQHDDALCGALGSLTIEAFVYVDHLPDAHEGWPRILSKYDHLDHDRRRGWEWVILPSGRLSFRVNQCPTDKPARGGDVSVDSPSPLSVRQWRHVATVYDLHKRQLRLYLDGKLAANQNMRPYPIRVNREQDLYLGRYGGADSSRFDGMIDELRIVADALSFTEAPAKPYTGREPNTVALYHFDQLTDDSGFVDAAPAHRHPAAVLMGADSLSRPSLPGFGQALRLVSGGE